MAEVPGLSTEIIPILKVKEEKAMPEVISTGAMITGAMITGAVITGAVNTVEMITGAMQVRVMATGMATDRQRERSTEAKMKDHRV